MRCAIYARVSTEEQAKRGYSLAAQVYACRKRAQELGATEILIFQDEESGSTLERPGLSEVRELIKAGEVDLLVVYDPDRLHRKLINQLVITEEIEKGGASLEFVNFDWKNTSEGRLFYQIRGAISEYEREKIRERMSFGKAQKARQGKIPLGFDCFGYNYEKGTGNISINEDEAEIVRLIFDMFINEGKSINAIARCLNDNGIPTKRRRGIWHRQVVRQLLMKNESYAGDWYYGKNKILIKIPPIIEKNTAEAAAKKLDQARRLWAGKGRRNYLLSGLISCGDCGNTMCGLWSKRWGNFERSYTCRKSYEGCKNEGCRPVKRIAAEELEQLVWGAVCSKLDDPAAVVKELNDEITGSTFTSELVRTQRLLDEVRKGRSNIVNMLSSGLICVDEKLRVQLAFLKAREEKLLARKEKLERQSRVLKKRTGHEEMELLAKEMLRKINDLAFEEKKVLLRTLLKQVVVTGRCDSINITIFIR